MSSYTTTERALIIIIYFENDRSIVRTQREFQRINNVETAPTPQTIKRLADIFRWFGLVGDLVRAGRPKGRRSIDNIEFVRIR